MELVKLYVFSLRIDANFDGACQDKTASSYRYQFSTKSTIFLKKWFSFRTSQINGLSYLLLVKTKNKRRLRLVPNLNFKSPPEMFFV